MKIYIFLMVLFFYSYSINAQTKGDFNWLFGAVPYQGENQATKIDFNTSPSTLSTLAIPFNFDITNASYSNDEGELLLYTNGISIANGQHQIIENGERITPGSIADTWQYFGYPVSQGALILPIPEQVNQYILLHMEIEYIGSGIGHKGVNLLKTIIDMNENNGLGLVVEKDIAVISDTLEFGNITSVKHANGRDWWILIHKNQSKYFYRLLLTPEGLKDFEVIDTEVITASDLGQSVFSPNGQIYAKITIESDEDFIDIYDFDRCEGILQHKTQIVLNDNTAFGGVAISPNNRFLYATYYEKIIQYDLEAADIAASADTVAIWDGFESPNVTRFFLAQLAPDGKIYINSFNQTNVLHVIHNPDEAGAACNVEQHGLQLPTLNLFSLPNFPNYRLGALQGSPCDTLLSSTLTIVPAEHQITLYPNPAIHSVRLQWSNPPKGAVVWRLYNALGQLVQEQTLWEMKEAEIAVGELAKGMYFYSVEQEDKMLKGGKLILQK